MSELYHHGVKGMKWGVRRYQNPDGTLTAAGRKKYIDDRKGGLTKAGQKRLNKVGRDSNEGKRIREEEFVSNVNRNWVDSYNKASDVFNSKIGSINKKFGDDAHVDNKEYIKAVGKMWTEAYSSQLIKDFGSEPISNGKDWVKSVPFMDNYDLANWFDD